MQLQRIPLRAVTSVELLIMLPLHPYFSITLRTQERAPPRHRERFEAQHVELPASLKIVLVMDL